MTFSRSSGCWTKSIKAGIRPMKVLHSSLLETVTNLMLFICILRTYTSLATKAKSRASSQHAGYQNISSSLMSPPICTFLRVFPGKNLLVSGVRGHHLKRFTYEDQFRKRAIRLTKMIKANHARCASPPHWISTPKLVWIHPSELCIHACVVFC
jgi:hypothetical protein